jgi:hypothetical protein
MAWADQYERNVRSTEYFILFYLMVADTSDEFFNQLNRIQTVDDSINAIVWIPAAKQHRQDDAMKLWARSSGYEALWRERGWPDLCRPVGDDDWECD